MPFPALLKYYKAADRDPFIFLQNKSNMAVAAR